MAGLSSVISIVAIAISAVVDFMKTVVTVCIVLEASAESGPAFVPTDLEHDR